MSLHEITLKVNGEEHTLTVKSNDLLLNVLRDQLHLTGAKYGCGIAECGACTVMHGDESVMSCLIPAASCDGWEITTAEGLATADGELNVVQAEFLDKSAVQCGYCTPGMVVASTALLRENPDPTEEEVRDYLRGNYCRCTGYHAIVEAVLAAAQDAQKGGRL